MNETANDPTDLAADEPDSSEDPVGSAVEAEDNAGDINPSPDVAVEPPAAPAEGFGWEIRLATPDDPFTAELVFTESGEEMLYCALTPLALKDLTVALVSVKDAQMRALLGEDYTPTAPTEVVVPQAAPERATKTPAKPKKPAKVPAEGSRKAARAANKEAKRGELEAKFSGVSEWRSQHSRSSTFLIAMCFILLVAFLISGSNL